MPTIFELIDQLSFLRGLPAVYALLATAVLVILAWDWRLTLLALMGHYLFAGLLFVDVLDARLAAIKAITGLFVCLILFMTGRQVNDGRYLTAMRAEAAASRRWTGDVKIGGYRLPVVLLRLFVALVLLLIGWIMAQQSAFGLSALPPEATYVNLAVYGLVGLGLLGLVTTDPMRAGLGILLALTGFELVYSAVDQSTSMLSLLAALSLTLALVISYLTQAYRARLLSAD